MDDPRLTPARPDLAAKYLEGKVKAARFVTGEEFCVVDAIAPLRQAPAADAEMVTQALKGERVTVYDRNGEGFAWGQLNSDGYVGWMADAALGKPAAAPTHKVTALRTFAFPAASIKQPPLDTLSMGALISVAREDGAFAVTREGWYLPHRHVGSLHAPDAEMAIMNARDVYTRRNEGVSIWVVRASDIAASSPSEKGPLFDPANSKVYRHPTFYDIPEELGHM